MYNNIKKNKNIDAENATKKNKKTKKIEAKDIEEPKVKERKRIQVDIQKLEGTSEEDQEEGIYLEVPGPGAKASCTTRSPASSTTGAGIEISSSSPLDSKASGASMGSITSPGSSGAGRETYFSTLTCGQNGLITDSSCTNAATNISAILAGDTDSKFTHKFGGKTTILGNDCNLNSSNYTHISGQLGQTGDKHGTSQGITQNITRLNIISSKSQSNPDEP